MTEIKEEKERRSQEAVFYNQLLISEARKELQQIVNYLNKYLDSPKYSSYN